MRQESTTLQERGDRASILHVPVTRASIDVIVRDAIAAIKGERT